MKNFLTDMMLFIYPISFEYVGASCLDSVWHVIKYAIYATYYLFKSLAPQSKFLNIYDSRIQI